MRWVLRIILVYVALALQNAVGLLVHIPTSSLGDIAPDLLAGAAVFVVLNVRGLSDVLIVCWVLGIGLDLTSTGGSGGASVVGPMALAYAAAAWVVFQLREAFYREQAVSQAVLAALFVLVAHGLWITMQLVLALRSAHWELYGRLMLQACLVALYSGALAPVVCAVLGRMAGWVISPAARSGRNR